MSSEVKRHKSLEHFVNYVLCLTWRRVAVRNTGRVNFSRSGHKAKLLPGGMVNQFVGGNKRDAHARVKSNRLCWLTPAARAVPYHPNQ